MKKLFHRMTVLAVAAIVWAIVPATTVPTFAHAQGVAANAVADFKAAVLRQFAALFASYAVRVAPWAAAFQSTIATELGFGVVGEYALDGATRAQPGVLKGTAANIVVGRWFTRDPADGQFLPGGAAGVPGGILANPKGYSSAGTAAGGALAPTLTLLAGTVGEFVTSTPGIVVALANAAVVGQGVYFADATGILSGGTAGAGQTQIAGAAIVRVANTNPGLAIVSLNGN